MQRIRLKSRMQHRRQWQVFLRLPTRKKWLLVEAALWLCAARILLTLIPFARIGNYLGQLRPAQNEFVPGRNSVAEGVSWAVSRAARALPFAAVCLPRALAASQMLYRRGVPSRLHFGAFQGCESGKLKTHSWLEACGIKVTGYPESDQCVRDRISGTGCLAAAYPR